MEAGPDELLQVHSTAPRPTSTRLSAEHSRSRANPFLPSPEPLTRFPARLPAAPGNQLSFRRKRAYPNPATGPFRFPPTRAAPCVYHHPEGLSTKRERQPIFVCINRHLLWRLRAAFTHCISGRLIDSGRALRSQRSPYIAYGDGARRRATSTRRRSILRTKNYARPPKPSRELHGNMIRQRYVFLPRSLRGARAAPSGNPNPVRARLEGARRSPGTTSSPTSGSNSPRSPRRPPPCARAVLPPTLATPRYMTGTWNPSLETAGLAPCALRSGPYTLA